MSKKDIDKMLGIDTSIDDFIDGLAIDDASKMKSIDDNVKNAIVQIDSQLSNYNLNQVGAIDLAQVEKSLNNISEMIDESKQVLKHIYEQIVTCELIDAETVQAYAKLFESVHLTVNEYISMYKDRLSFLDKIKYSILQLQQKKDFELYKHQLAMERIKMKTTEDATDVTNSETIAYKLEDITKMI